MRRFLTLVSLLCLALPAGISISGCVRNPGENYCNGLGYGPKITDVAGVTLQPQIAGISLAFGQTTQVQSPQATTCKGTAASVNASKYQYGTSDLSRQYVDISPTGNLCAGSWNRNTGGGIADYTYCTAPSVLPTTNGLPYLTAYITASIDSVTSNPVAVHVHAPVTSIALAGPSSCLSQTQTAQLDALAYYSNNGTQTLLCQPSASATVTGYSVSSNVVTLTAANSFVAGESVTFSGLKSATFLNNQLFTVLPAGLSSTQFEVAATAANAAFTADSGTAATSTANPTCPSSIGTMTFSVGTGSVASIDPTTNIITALMPGTTAITASIAGSGSSAGYFSTCPPQSISLTLANGATSGTVTRGVEQNLTTTVLDTQGHAITGLTLDYQSTNPLDITVGSSGAINAAYPGAASVYAICQPGTCNPSPINQLGLNSTGVSIASNAVNLITPGTASDYFWFAAPGQSQYFVPVELLTGTLGSTVRLPYVPNSMVMDKTGSSLYFGSPRELMVFSTAANSIAKQDATVPGVVLAVSPDNTQVLINDQARHVFYVYSVSSGSSVTFPGMGSAAMWTPDSKTLYITDNANLNPTGCGSTTPQINGHTDTLYVYNVNTGWSVYALPPSPLPPGVQPSCSAIPNTASAAPLQTPAITVPGVGAYLRGTPTVAHTWCPSGTVGNTASMTFYPVGDTQPVESDVLAATPDGQHILGAQWTAGGSILLNDIGVTIPSVTVNGITSPAACPVTTTGSGASQVQTLKPLLIQSTVNPVTIAGVNATSVNQVVVGATPSTTTTAQSSPLAFITYNGSTPNAKLPLYVPGAKGTAGTVYPITLSGSSSITAPLTGAFSPDNTLFFVSTAGDNKVHYISIPATVSPSSLPTDQQQVSPNLPGCDPSLDSGCTFTGTPGATVPVTAIVVKPRSTT